MAHVNGSVRMSLDENVFRTKKGTKMSSLQKLTLDDRKILGNSTAKRLEKTVPPPQYHSQSFQTYKSAWTPISNKASNQTLFTERKELVSCWFDMWTDAQRKRFLDAILRQCNRNQYHYIWCWMRDYVPLRNADFTNILPRFLSLYIFSFLDPRSLCRASMVSWQWKFLSEQDVVWEQKCVRHGWYLPYEPALNEYGAWKNHYVSCLSSMDLDGPSAKRSLLYGSIGDGSDKFKKMRKKRLTEEESSSVMLTRQPWLPPDKNPKDFDKTNSALWHDYNPNDVPKDASLLVHHNKFGILKTRLSSYDALRHEPDSGLHSSERKAGHRALEGGEDEGLNSTGYRASLDEKMHTESFDEKRLIELRNLTWEAPHESAPTKGNLRPNLSGGGAYPLPWKHSNKPAISKSFPSQAHPRIIFISSRVPAADVIVDAVMFGVIPIVYEYEGTTLDSLLSQLDRCLQGRNAQSIGVFAHAGAPGDLQLVHGSTVNVDNLDTPEFVEFFETLTNCVLPPSKQGHVDIFVPLAATESGMEMLIQLEVLTGMKFSSPTGIIGNYNHINSAWLPSPEAKSPHEHYFCASKLHVWANTADQVAEACRRTKELMSTYFKEQHRDVVSQITGQVLFDMLGQDQVSGSGPLISVLTDGMALMSQETNPKPLEFLGTYLLERAGIKDVNILTSSTRRQHPGDTLKPSATLSAQTLQGHLTLDEEFDESLQNSEIMEELDEEVAVTMNPNKQDKERKNQQEASLTSPHPQQIGGEMEMEKPKTLRFSATDEQISLHTALSDALGKADSLQQSGMLSSRMASGRTKRLTLENLAEVTDRRMAVAQEVLASEEAYVATLEIIQDVFHTPLRNALQSNRAIASAQIMQVIFTDPQIILDATRGLKNDLAQRIDDWSPQNCIGDIFVKFCTKLKVYTNFLTNYQLILSSIERGVEQMPAFRAFLKRHERTPKSRMLTLPELLLCIVRRIGEYVTLLAWFKMYTPPEHADRKDLNIALRTLGQLETVVKDSKKRGESEREMIAIQKKIINCPLLLEANRFFLKQLDVAGLKAPSNDTIKPEMRMFQQVEVLGLFLFNDSLVVTRRTTKHFPYERSVESVYRFEACTSLTRLRIEDIADTKYQQNAFRMYTPKREWICAADTYDEKFNWITLLEGTVRTHVNS